jgi:Xaa-Pro aminopeptidase
VFDYAARQNRLSERLEREGIAGLFLAPSSDLEYLTGVERQLPIFGEVNYAHGWVTGAFFRPGQEPVFVFPRMFAAFDLREQPQGDVIVVNETDDGVAVFERIAKQIAGAGGVAVGDRVWAETTLRLGRTLGFERLRTGTRLVNELRRTKDADELAPPSSSPASRCSSSPKPWSTSCSPPGRERPRSPRTSSPASTQARSTRIPGRGASRSPRARR